MSTEQLERQRARAGRNQSLFREVNERIEELSSGSAEAEAEYVCECLDLACVETIVMSHREYARIRRNPIEFFVCPGHEQPTVEDVVHRDMRWVIVRKVGAGAVAAVEA